MKNITKLEQFNYQNLYKSFIPATYQSPGTPSKGRNDEVQIPLLFTPLTIKNTTFKNRITASPMCQYSSNVNGMMNEWHFSHYTSLAKGGAGLVIMEASAVTPNGRISPMDTGIWQDEQIPPIKQIVDFMHQFDTKVGIQIAHAGRKASTNPPFTVNGRDVANPTTRHGWEDISSPSSIPFSGTEPVTPHELTIEEIEQVVNEFKEAAIRVEKAGIDVLEIHGAHGYLISSFLSPTSNKRTDKYGGSFQGRIQLLLEIIHAVRQVWDHSKPLFVRISCDEWVGDQGWTIKDSNELAVILQDLDVDLLDCSSGGNNSKQVIQARPLYQVEFANSIKKNPLIKKLKISTVGIIEDATNSESILQNGSADLIMLARPFLRDPFWPLRAAEELNIVVDYSLQYELSQKKRYLGKQ